MTDVCSRVTDFRSGLYIYLSQNINIIIRDNLIVDAAGDVLPIFQGTRREIMSRIGGIIWARGMDFDGGCHSDFWLDFPTVGPLLAHKYRRTFVSYSDGVQGNGVQNRSTIIAFYEEETSRVMMYDFIGVYLSQPLGAVCLSHSQNHYNLRGRNKTLHSLFTTVTHFGIGKNALIGQDRRCIFLETMKWTPSVIVDDNATDQRIDNPVGNPHLKEINEREESFTSGASINVSVVHALSNETCRAVAYVSSDVESE